MLTSQLSQVRLNNIQSYASSSMTFLHLKLPGFVVVIPSWTLGNAHILINENAFRFGKYTELQFTEPRCAAPRPSITVRTQPRSRCTFRRATSSTIFSVARHPRNDNTCDVSTRRHFSKLVTVGYRVVAETYATMHNSSNS